MTPYIGTKRLLARAMTRGVYNAYRGWEVPSNENPADAGYLVEHQDGGKGNHPDHAGYISWSPKEQFEAAYQPTDAMTFGHALEMLKAGHAVARAGWNGRGMFVYHVPAARYPAQTGIAKRYWGEQETVPYNAYFALKGVDGAVSTWVPSVTDCVAEDWGLVS
jgi:hypothetical protein